MSYQTLLYTVEDAIATITLNRPEALNTIVPPMPDEIEAAVNAAVRDERIKVIILRSAGRSFCGGLRLRRRIPPMGRAHHHRRRVGGGSDYALCADLVIASEDARIGTPHSRMWGAWLSGMWLHRLGLTKAKEFALTGKPLSGRAVRGLQPGSAGPAAGPEERDPVTIDAVVSVENRRANRGRAGIMRGSLSSSGTP